MPTYRSISGSSAGDLLIELFINTFGAEKAGQLYLLKVKSCTLEPPRRLPSRTPASKLGLAGLWPRR